MNLRIYHTLYIMSLQSIYEFEDYLTEDEIKIYNKCTTHLYIFMFGFLIIYNTVLLIV
jgi:hypothetical protein